LILMGILKESTPVNATEYKEGEIIGVTFTSKLLPLFIVNTFLLTNRDIARLCAPIPIELKLIGLSLIG